MGLFSGKDNSDLQPKTQPVQSQPTRVTNNEIIITCSVLMKDGHMIDFKCINYRTEKSGVLVIEHPADIYDTYINSSEWVTVTDKRAL